MLMDIPIVKGTYDHEERKVEEEYYRNELLQRDRWELHSDREEQFFFFLRRPQRQHQWMASAAAPTSYTSLFPLHSFQCIHFRNS
jgi:hypothetical protein